MNNALASLRQYAQRKGSAAAGRLSAIQCWRELSRVSGVNSYATLGRLEAMRAILHSGYNQNEMTCLRRIAVAEGLSPVSNLNEAGVYAALANPAQFIQNHTQSGGILTLLNSEKLALPISTPVGQVVHITDAVQVSGGVQNGVYSKRGLYNSKSLFNLLGENESNESNAIGWSTDLNGDYGLTPVSAGFYIVGSSSVVYYSTSAVATPDLASNWKNASDDSPANITVVNPAVQQLAVADPSDESHWVSV